MALAFGWRASEVRESYWITDPDLADVSEAARQAWADDGDASHLRPFVKPGGKPTRITFRTLTSDEVAAVKTLIRRSELSQDRVINLCFRLGVDIPDLPAELPDAGGAMHPRITTDFGLRTLADGFVRGLEDAYPGITAFYGGMVFNASFATETEKKASSPPSTPRPSSAAELTAAGTASSASDASGAT